MAKWTLVILDGRGWGVGGVTTVCGRDYIAVAGVHETSSQAGAHIIVVSLVAPQRNRVQAVPEVYGYTGVNNVIN